jgi:hypothetical protein
MKAVTAAAIFAAATLTATPATAAPSTGADTVDLIVGLTSDTAAARTVRSLSSEASVEVVGSKVNKTLDAVTVTVNSEDVNAATAVLRGEPGVEFVEKKTFYSADLTPNDTLFSQQWGLKQATVPAAWDTTTGSSSVVIAVIDSGVNEVSELAGRILPGYDFVNKDTDPADDHGHGTMVATVAAAKGNNGSRIAGVCWSCKILPVKVLAPAAGGGSVGSSEDIASGIIWAADHGADVINLSLGGPDDSKLMRDAVEYAVSRDVLVITSAGNDGSTTRQYPAGVEQSVAVAGTNVFDEPESWTNRGGDWVDVAAPGTNLAQNHLGTSVSFWGTSSAAPVVAGIGALAMAANPKASAAQVRAAIEKEADPVGSWVAKGRVDAKGTLDAITAHTPEPDPTTPTPEPTPTTPTPEPTPTQPADTQAPSAQFTVASVVSGTVRIALDDPSDDTAKLELFVNGDPAARASVSTAPWAVEWDSTTLPDGPARLRAVVADTSGNSSEAVRDVTIANTPPSPDPTTEPTTNPTAEPTTEPTTDPTTEPTAEPTTDPSTQPTLEPTAGPTTEPTSGPTAEPTAEPTSEPTVEPTTEPTSEPTTGPTTQPTTGPTTGPTTEPTAEPTTEPTSEPTTGPTTQPTTGPTQPADTQAPSPAFTLPAVVRGTLQVNLSQPAVDLASMELRVGDWSAGMTTAAPWQVGWSSLGTPDGMVTMTVVVTDHAGNKAQATRQVRLDNNAPTIKSVSPWPSAVRGAVTLGVNAFDTAGVAKAELLVDGRVAATDTTAPYQLTVRTSGTGNRTWTVRVTDKTGLARTLTRTVTYDHTAPYVTASPANGSKVNRTFTIRANGYDSGSGVARIDVWADGDWIKSTRSASISVTVKAGKRSGKVTYKVKVTDKVGNVTWISRTVKVQ